MSTKIVPRSFANKSAPRLTPKLTSVVEEIVRGYQAKTKTEGTSVAAGHVVSVPLGVKNRLNTVLKDIADGRETDPAKRIVSLLGGVKVVKKAADVLQKLPNGADVVAGSIALALGSGDDGSTTGTGTRQTWANQRANQHSQPLQISRPASLSDPNDEQSIQNVLANALKNACVARGAGSGHSYSDVATCPDFFVDTHGLNRIASSEHPISGQLSPSVLQSTLPLALGPVDFPSYDPDDNHALIEMEAGITIRDLNPALEAWNLALMNMGGYDGQTIIGAISTSTHGSGIGLGPFSDMVRSVVLATTGEWKGNKVSGGGPKKGVYYYRIEPADGITDPTKYSDPTIALIQDDDCFKSVICSMGCFGVIYSVVIEVMQMYYLTETRYLTTLAEVMKDLAPDPSNPGNLPSVLQDNRHYQVLIHPYPMLLTVLLTAKLGQTLDAEKDLRAPGEEPVSAARASGDLSIGEIIKLLSSVITMSSLLPAKTYYPFFLCCVTKRNIANPPANPKSRFILPSFLAILLNLLLDAEPELIPDAIALSLVTQIDTNWVGKSYEVFSQGLGGNFGFAAEIGFSLEDGDKSYTQKNFQSAIDKIHSVAQTARLQGNQYQTSAFSLRFVKASDAHLSMMQGRNTAMIEMDMLTGSYAGAEIMYRYETNMYQFGGRPHWGLEFDLLSGNNNLLQSLYPKLGDWLSVYNQLNAKGTFNNSFTQRMGFTRIETPKQAPPIRRRPSQAQPKKPKKARSRTPTG